MAASKGLWKLHCEFDRILAMNLAKKVFNLRHDRKLTIHALAARARVCYAKISNIERGISAAYDNALFRIARALNVPHEYLIDDSQEYPYQPVRYRENKVAVETKAKTRMQLTREEAAFLKALRQASAETNEPEYLVYLPKDKLKRTRVARSEPTLQSETVRYADIVLSALKDDDTVFRFGYRQALKFLKSAVRRSGAVCLPNRDKISWKDLRSGMACYLLKHGWTTDEVNFRLGHKPSSREIDVYVSHLAIDRHKPKKKLFDTTMEKIQRELEEGQRREKLSVDRLRRQGEENEALRLELEQTQHDLKQLASIVQGIVRRVRVA